MNPTSSESLTKELLPQTSEPVLKISTHSSWFWKSSHNKWEAWQCGQYIVRLPCQSSWAQAWFIQGTYLDGVPNNTGKSCMHAWFDLLTLRRATPETSVNRTSLWLRTVGTISLKSSLAITSDWPRGAGASQPEPDPEGGCRVGFWVQLLWEVTYI